MDPIVNELINFRDLQTFVTENEGSLIELTKRYYAMLGNDLGFKCESPFNATINGCSFGLDIAWFDETNLEVAFEFEFGNLEELLAGIAKLILSNANHSVLVTSSKARIADLNSIVDLAGRLSPYAQNLLIMDLSEERYVLL